MIKMNLQWFLVYFMVEIVMSADSMDPKNSSTVVLNDSALNSQNVADSVGSLTMFEDEIVEDINHNDFDEYNSVRESDQVLDSPFQSGVQSSPDFDQSAAAYRDKVDKDPKIASPESFLNFNDEKSLDLVEDGESVNSSVEIVDENTKILRRLAALVDKMDKNKSGKISAREIRNWIAYLQSRHIRADSQRQFNVHDKDKDGLVNWLEYREHTYGFLNKAVFEDEDADSIYKRMLHRDQRRWHGADKNVDGLCTFEEFMVFLHPEQFEDTHHIVVQETMEELDKDKNGVVDVEEYINDLMPSRNSGNEPEWVTRERKTFLTNKDIDKNGVIDKREVQAWLFPDNDYYNDAEVKFLLDRADDDDDGELAKAEILEHYDVFQVSQVTEWGELLKEDEF